MTRFQSAQIMSVAFAATFVLANLAQVISRHGFQ